MVCSGVIARSGSEGWWREWSMVERAGGEWESGDGYRSVSSRIEPVVLMLGTLPHALSNSGDGRGKAVYPGIGVGVRIGWLSLRSFAEMGCDDSARKQGGTDGPSASLETRVKLFHGAGSKVVASEK